MKWISSFAILSLFYSGGIPYAAQRYFPPIVVRQPPKSAFPQTGLLVDLNADQNFFEEAGRVEKWVSSVIGRLPKEFVKQDKGRKESGSGRPSIRKKVSALNGHNSLVFDQQELTCMDEDVFDSLSTGSGYTWITILSVGRQPGELPNVNSFFGNLKNGGNYEGFWAGLTDDNKLWGGSRNGRTFGRWDVNNPFIPISEPLKTDIYYILAGRMESGTDTVRIELFVNQTKPKTSGLFPVNPNANASRLSIGQERDAIEHPGRESFRGEIARYLLYNRPLTDAEMSRVFRYLKRTYGIKE